MTVRITRGELHSLLKSITKGTVKRPVRFNVARKIARLRASMAKDIGKHMQAWLVLMDEAVHFWILFEEVQHTRKLTKATSPFAMQIAKIRALAISIRELILLGQDVPSHALARIFLEELEIAYVMLFDTAFILNFMDESDEHDDDDFWKSNIGYGRIYSRLQDALVKAGWTEEAAKEKIAQHREIKTTLSRTIHPSSSASFRAMAVPSLIKPGLFAVKTLGHLSAHMPRLSLFLASETQGFASTIGSLITSGKPPDVLAGYKGWQRNTGMMRSVILLQDLIDKHSDAMWRHADYALNPEGVKSV